MTTEDYPKELKEKIKALKENIQQQIKDITTEYANISEKKIKREEKFFREETGALYSAPGGGVRSNSEFEAENGNRKINRK